MQPPTWLPALLNGVQVMPLGHSPSEVHIWIEPEGHVGPAWQIVPCIMLAKFWHAMPFIIPPSPIDAPTLLQHTCPELQSAIGSSHCQSVSVAPHGVARSWQEDGRPPAFVSQQCWVPPVQYWFLPPSTPLKGQ